MNKETKGWLQLILFESWFIASIIIGYIFEPKIRAEPYGFIWAMGAAMILTFGVWCMCGGTFTPRTL